MRYIHKKTVDGKDMIFLLYADNNDGIEKIEYKYGTEGYVLEGTHGCGKEEIMEKIKNFTGNINGEVSVYDLDKLLRGNDEGKKIVLKNEKLGIEFGIEKDGEEGVKARYKYGENEEVNIKDRGVDLRYYVYVGDTALFYNRHNGDYGKFKDYINENRQTVSLDFQEKEEWAHRYRKVWEEGEYNCKELVPVKVKVWKSPQDAGVCGLKFETGGSEVFFSLKDTDSEKVKGLADSVINEINEYRELLGSDKGSVESSLKTVIKEMVNGYRYENEKAERMKCVMHREYRGKLVDGMRIGGRMGYMEDLSKYISCGTGGGVDKYCYVRNPWEKEKGKHGRLYILNRYNGKGKGGEYWMFRKDFNSKSAEEFTRQWDKRNIRKEETIIRKEKKKIHDMYSYLNRKGTEKKSIKGARI